MEIKFNFLFKSSEQFLNEFFFNSLVFLGLDLTYTMLQNYINYQITYLYDLYLWCISYVLLAYIFQGLFYSEFQFLKNRKNIVKNSQKKKNSENS